MTDREKFRQVLSKRSIKPATSDEMKKVREISEDLQGMALFAKGYEKMGEVDCGLLPVEGLGLGSGQVRVGPCRRKAERNRGGRRR